MSWGKHPGLVSPKSEWKRMEASRRRVYRAVNSGLGVAGTPYKKANAREARCPLPLVGNWASQRLLGNNPDVPIEHRIAVALKLERASAGILLFPTGRRSFQLKVLVDRYAVVFD